jgi:YD repeat-containing protein
VDAALQVHRRYFPTGQLAKTWGRDVDPVEYTYDSQGRLTALRSWREFGNRKGVTTHFDSPGPER